MTFKIKSISGKTIEINSNIVPCCESGHGECETILESKIFGICCGDCGFPNDDSMGVDVFWWNTILDDEFEIQKRPPSIKDIRLRQRKGCKMARDIVAMLARKHREEVLKVYHEWCGTLGYRYQDGKRYVFYRLYQEAKSMLG